MNKVNISGSDNRLIGIDYFDKLSDQWIKDYNNKIERWNEYNKKLRRENIACELIQSAQKGAVIDLGCGVGSLLKRFCSMGFQRVIGVDISNNMISVARKIDNNIELFNCDVQNISPVKSNSIDVCSALGVIEYFRDDKPFLKEINRILKINGVVVIQARNAKIIKLPILKFIKSILTINKSRDYIKGDYIYREHNPKNLKSSLNKCGFEIMEERFLKFFDILPFHKIPIMGMAFHHFDIFCGKILESFLSDKKVARYFGYMYFVKARKVNNIND